MYGGGEVSELGGKFDIEYKNNIEVGTASITVTSLEEDFKGQISAEFEIKPLEDIFSDIKYDDWFFNSVNYMYTNSYMSGTDSKKFSPNDTLTRAMAVEILYRTSDGMGIGDKTFKDVSKDAYYYEAVRWAVQNKITEGYNDEYFAPDDPITREQLMAMLYRYSGGEGDTAKEELTYIDSADINAYALDAAGWMTKNNIITGYADNTLRPKNNVSRAETAAILERLSEINN